MSKEKQIEEMFNLVVDGVIDGEDNHGVPTGKTCFDIAESLYNAGYRKQSGWISVEERLPDRPGRFLAYSAGVLIVNYTPNYTLGEQSLMGRAVWFSYDSEWGDYEIKGVTHWMPLPSPPKKEKNND